MVDFDRDGGNEGYSMLWKYRTGWSVDSVSITPNGKYVVAGSWDNHVYLFASPQAISILEMKGNCYGSIRWMVVFGQYL